jgi:hypothetical protein
MFEENRIEMILKQILPIIILSMLSACVASPPRYVAPAGLTTQSAATLTGSKTRTPAKLLPNAFISASAIDGASVSGNWNKPILLLPGEHTVQFGPCLCDTWYLSPSSGSVALIADFKADQIYVMRSTIPASFYATRTAQVWIQTASGVQVTPKVTIPLMAAPTPMIIFQPNLSK